MIKILEENPLVGMVCGNRHDGYINEKASHNIFQIGNRLLAVTHNMLNGVPLQDPLTGLRVNTLGNLARMASKIQRF